MVRIQQNRAGFRPTLIIISPKYNYTTLISLMLAYLTTKICQRGFTAWKKPLSKSLPGSKDKGEGTGDDEDEDLVQSNVVVSENISVSCTDWQILSSSFTTFDIGGLISGLSSQHHNANSANFFTLSGEHCPIRLSASDRTVPHSFAILTCITLYRESLKKSVDLFRNQLSRFARVLSQEKYLADNMCTLKEWMHSSQELKQHYSEAVHIALHRQLLSHEVLWIQISLCIQVVFSNAIAPRNIMFCLPKSYISTSMPVWNSPVFLSPQLIHGRAHHLHPQKQEPTVTVQNRQL